MTKRDFELIARVFAQMKEEGLLLGLELAFPAYAMADALAATNPRFDRERFLIACGVISKSGNEVEDNET